ncbi:hypothetical protein ZIOFF_064611 [Zingiber officinale]|uniref:DNA-3-methyladenine glycosylase I n=1 Tax=Zingiber officinale TaxID=94328 RepID=A0A8J5EYM5_ZINOF|nr:hypothetical protein ZIOFF_064611 [Zingiber officinale]
MCSLNAVAFAMGRHVVERIPSAREVERRSSQAKSALSRHLQRVYPLSIKKSCSLLSLSSLSLSQNSNASSLNSSFSSWDPKNSVSLRKLFGSWEGTETGFGVDDLRSLRGGEDPASGILSDELGSGKRCNWITEFSDEAYISFHDEYWGVPIYNDNRLFELLALCGMLIDHNWTEILRRREIYRKVFLEFDHHLVAKMEEKDIMDITFDKELMLAECRVRCIVDNAKCIQKVSEEFGSFCKYVWSQVNHKPMVNKYKCSRSVPLRTPKSEAMSKDLVRRGFRLVGPVIVYSFMQAAGLANDHLVHCFRFDECVRFGERGGIPLPYKD